MLGRSNASGGGGGTSPSGSVSITDNGTHNVSSYASASVSVPNIPSFTYVGKKTTTATNGTYNTTISDLVAGSDYVVFLHWRNSNFSSTSGTYYARINSVTGAERYSLITTNISDENHNVYYLYNCNSSITLNTSHNQPNVHVGLGISYYKVDYTAG